MDSRPRVRRCGRLRRWWHRRLREQDVLWLLPALRLKAEMAAAEQPDVPLYGIAHERFIEQKIDAAMALHKALPGQEHWRCACAQEDGDAR